MPKWKNGFSTVVVKKQFAQLWWATVVVKNRCCKDFLVTKEMLHRFSLDQARRQDSVTGGSQTNFGEAQKLDVFEFESVNKKNCSSPNSKSGMKTKKQTKKKGHQLKSYANFHKFLGRTTKINGFYCKIYKKTVLAH